MRLISRYILFELLKVFGLALGIMTLMFILIGLVREANEQGLHLTQIVQIIPFILPDALRYTVPATILLAACMVYGRMASSNEITALKSLGINPMTVLWPVLILSFLLSISTVWLNDVAVSWGRAGVRRVVLESVEDIVYGMLQAQRTYSSKQISIVVKRVDGRKLISPTITIQGKKGGGSITMSSEEAELRSDVEEGALTIVCRNGELEVEGQARVFFHNDVFERSIPLDQGSLKDEEQHPSYTALNRVPVVIDKLRGEMSDEYDFMAAKAALAMMAGDLGELASEEWQLQDNVLRKNQEKIYRLQTEPHRRWSNGFSCFCFALVGSSLAIRMRNADFLTSFFMCFMPILLVYYPLLAFGVDFSKNGSLPPQSVWAGNLILIAGGAWILRKVVRY
ncbi:MAG: LptF/LptG family permease [Planctomycetaceae bacterium]|nr:LptF/LptG family permease [Planctomycetaceae bacterium]